MILRDPPAETEDYPGLIVADNRVTGSITTGRSRLPLWAFAWNALTEGWAVVENGWQPSKYGYTADTMGLFLANLLNQRGEFGRLICIMADVERIEEELGGPLADVPAWWETPIQKQRMITQLKRCLAVLEPPADEPRLDDAPSEQ